MINDYKNINDYKSIKNINDINDINDYKGIFVSIKNIFVSIKNNISIYIVEVPNETAPSIQGFARPPA